ncbi:hypothetical protein ACHAWF_007791 [Thalassiosira exigua]
MGSAHGLACKLFSLLEAWACPHLAPGTLVASHRLWGEGGQCTLRFNHYPPVDPRLLDEAQGRSLWRAGAHTDWGCLTLLFQRLGEDGLECRSKGKSRWIPVLSVEGGIPVNVGDMLRLWSDERLTSNLHRVRMPRTVDECSKSRYSTAFFLQADRTAVIDSGGSNGVMTAGEYFAGRINSNFAP